MDPGLDRDRTAGCLNEKFWEKRKALEKHSQHEEKGSLGFIEAVFINGNESCHTTDVSWAYPNIKSYPKVEYYDM